MSYAVGRGCCSESFVQFTHRSSVTAVANAFERTHIVSASAVVSTKRAIVGVAFVDVQTINSCVARGTLTFIVAAKAYANATIRTRAVRTYTHKPLTSRAPVTEHTLAFITTDLFMARAIVHAWIRGNWLSRRRRM